jgi:hypothetical protein
MLPSVSVCFCFIVKAIGILQGGRAQNYMKCLIYSLLVLHGRVLAVTGSLLHIYRATRLGGCIISVYVRLCQCFN